VWESIERLQIAFFHMYTPLQLEPEQKLGLWIKGWCTKTIPSFRQSGGCNAKCIDMWRL
jgi:hypothetical protein